MKYCGNCGSKINGKFCSNCGAKIEENTQITPEMTEYLNNRINSSKYHNGYRISTGIIMIIVSVLILIAAMYLDSISSNPFRYYNISNYEKILSSIGTSIAFALTIPGLLVLAGGIFSIVSKKNNNLLLVSGILYLVAALCNMIAISDISILFILACTFGIINIVFYSKAR